MSFPKALAAGIMAAMLLFAPACSNGAAAPAETAAQPSPPTARALPSNDGERLEKWEALGLIENTDPKKALQPLSLEGLYTKLERLVGLPGADGLGGASAFYQSLNASSDSLEPPSPEETVSLGEGALLLFKALELSGYAEAAGVSPENEGALEKMLELGCLESLDEEYLDSELSLLGLLELLDGLINDIITEPAVLSGSYGQGIVIRSDGVSLEGARVGGLVYFLPSEPESTLEIKDSGLDGGLFVSGDEPRLIISASELDFLKLDSSAYLDFDAEAGLLEARDGGELILGNTALIDELVASGPLSVSGRGMLVSAALLGGGSDSEFELLPHALIDLGAGTYEGQLTEGIFETGGLRFCVDSEQNPVFGFAMVYDREYYFHPQGLRALGAMEIDGNDFYFTDTGELYRGWLESDEGLRYYDEYGIMAKGPCQIGDELYIFSSQGKRLRGIFTLEGYIYVTDDEGRIAPGFVSYKGNDYFSDELGRMLTGLREYQGNQYYFDKDTGILLRDGEKDGYTADSEGVISSRRISTGDKELDAQLDKIVADLTDDSMSLDEKMYAVYYWAGRNVNYRATPIDLSKGFTEELVIEHTRNTLNTRRGACEHFAMVTATLFGRLGVETMLIEGYRYSTYYGTWDEHSWTLAQLDGVWYHFDTLYEYQHTGTARSCFMKSDSNFEAHHTWDRDKYPACGG